MVEMAEMNSTNAKLCRDMAIGCAGRLVSCAGFMREKLSDSLFRECFAVCGLLIVDTSALADRVVDQFPELRFTDNERAVIESEHAGRSVVAPSENPRTRLLIDVGAVEDRILTIRTMAPELESDINIVINELGAFAKLVGEKVPETA